VKGYAQTLGILLEPLARRVWPPLFLSAIVVLTWALVDNFAHGDPVWTDAAVKMFLMLMIVLGLQVFSGNSGVLSFGHIAFMAIGAYSSALLTIPTAIKKFTFLTMPHFLKFWVFPAQLNALEGTLAGAGFAMAFALVTAAPIVRLTGVAAGIATLAILVIVHEFDYQTSAITRGTSTQIGVPTTTTFLSVLVWALIFIGVAFAFQQSRFGLRLRASRENERAAKSVGVRVSVERAIAWTISGFIVGVAGTQYAHYFGGTFGPDDFFFNNGFNIVLLSIAMLVVGGMTSVTGAVAGCYFITVIFEAFRRWEVNGLGGVTPPAGTSNLVLALVLLVTLVLRPKGITGGKEIPWPTEWRRPRAPSLEPRAIVARFRGTAAANEPAASAETAPTD
jgi:branched-chain amino acid transport system permease protein